MIAKGFTNNLKEELRRAALVKGDRSKGQRSLAPRLKELTDKQLFMLWKALSAEQKSIKSMVKVVKDKWEKFQDVTDYNLEILIGRFFAEMKLNANRENAIELSSKVKQLHHQVRELTTQQADIEKKIIETFNPLYELAVLSNIQKKRIEHFAELEEMDEKPNRHLDEMIDKLRLLVAEYVKAMGGLRVGAKPDDGEASAGKKHLNEIHLHLQNVIASPQRMTTAIDKLESELNELVVVPVNQPAEIEESKIDTGNETHPDREGNLET